MTAATNKLGQPVGQLLPGWKPPPPPGREPMAGRFCQLESLDPTRHADALFEANARDEEGRMWTYLPYGPFAAADHYRAWMTGVCGVSDPAFFAIVDRQTDRPVGVASYLRMDPSAGSIEVGHLAYSPLLQRAPAATEAMYLMMERVFELGYRRYEWKCDALNEPSRVAALRLGFAFEGVFRQARVTKDGRNRDTAWYSVIDAEWLARREAFRRWLSPENFDDRGRQRHRLSELMAEGETGG